METGVGIKNAQNRRSLCIVHDSLKAHNVSGAVANLDSARMGWTELASPITEVNNGLGQHVGPSFGVGSKEGTRCLQRS